MSRKISHTTSGNTINEYVPSKSSQLLNGRRSPRRLTLPEEEICRRYVSGETEQALAKAFNTSRRTIATRLQENGVTHRTQSETQRIRAIAQTPEQRSAQARAAHEAVRGREHSFEEKCQRAQTRQIKQLGISAHEALLCYWLAERGFSSIPQCAIGPYNTDLAIHPVAVEIYGGGWHSGGRHFARVAERTRYILDQGWNLIFVWVDRRKWPLTIGCAEYLIAFLEQASIDPSLRGEYRVIRGNGQEFPASSFYFNKTTGIPTSSTTDDLRP